MIVATVTIVCKISGTISVGNGKFKWRVPYAGELVAVNGYIETLGSGAGTSTDIMVSNSTQATDMLSTVGAYEVNSATKLLEGQVINDTYRAFAKNDDIYLDVDAISTSPANAHVYLTVILYCDDL